VDPFVQRPDSRQHHGFRPQRLAADPAGGFLAGLLDHWWKESSAARMTCIGSPCGWTATATFTGHTPQIEVETAELLPAGRDDLFCLL